MGRVPRLTQKRIVLSRTSITPIIEYRICILTISDLIVHKLHINPIRHFMITAFVPFLALRCLQPSTFLTDLTGNFSKQMASYVIIDNNAQLTLMNFAADETSYFIIVQATLISALFVI